MVHSQSVIHIQVRFCLVLAVDQIGKILSDDLISENCTDTGAMVIK